MASLLVAATTIDSFTASWFAFRTSAKLAERQLVQAREFDAAVQILALVHQLERARTVAAVRALEARLREGLSPATHELQEGFRVMVEESG